MKPCNSSSMHDTDCLPRCRLPCSLLIGPKDPQGSVNFARVRLGQVIDIDATKTIVDTIPLPQEGSEEDGEVQTKAALLAIIDTKNIVAANTVLGWKLIQRTAKLCFIQVAEDWGDVCFHNQHPLWIMNALLMREQVISCDKRRFSAARP